MMQQLHTPVTNSKNIKRYNRARIYDLIRKETNISKQQIANRLHLSLPTVIQNLNELQQMELIRPNGYHDSTGGRRAQHYEIVSDYRIAVGLSITRHHIAAVAVDLNGHTIASVRRRQTFSFTDEYFRTLGAAVDQLIENHRLPPDRILGVGISIPGLIDSSRTRTYYCRVLDLDSASTDDFARYIRFPSFLCHDVASAASAERWSNNIPTFFYIMLNDSIGGAIIINHETFEGVNNRSAEIGHIKIRPGGKKCYCGKRGCMDSYCSAKVLTSITDGELHIFFDRLTAHDEQASRIWETYLDHLAVAINDIRMLYDCDIILGGHVGEHFDDYIDCLKKRVSKLDPFTTNADYVRVCKARNEASAVGAALSFIDDFLQKNP